MTDRGRVVPPELSLQWKHLSGRNGGKGRMVGGTDKGKRRIVDGSITHKQNNKPD